MARIAMVVSFLLLSVLSAGAQDLLFEGTRQIGAIGHFGRDVGPAPALVHQPLIGGGRFVISGDVAVDWRAGASVPLGPGFLVGFDRARPRVYMARPDGVWDVDVVTGISLLVLPVPTTDLVTCATRLLGGRAVLRLRPSRWPAGHRQARAGRGRTGADHPVRQHRPAQLGSDA